MAITGGSWLNCWCAQIAPGGRPSIGPMPPPSAGSTGCCVVFAWAVGAGFKTETGFRGNTSKRGIGCEKAVAVKSGRGGSPIGILESAYALRANGLRPLIGSIRPALVNIPILIKSRREICPCERALIISCRFFRACSASRKRAFEAFGDKKKFLSGICFSFVRQKSEEYFRRSGTVGGFHSRNAEACFRSMDHLVWFGVCQFLSNEKSEPVTGCKR